MDVSLSYKYFLEGISNEDTQFYHQLRARWLVVARALILFYFILEIHFFFVGVSGGNDCCDCFWEWTRLPPLSRQVYSREYLGSNRKLSATDVVQEHRLKNRPSQ